MIVEAQVRAWAVDSAEFPWRLNYGTDTQNKQVRDHFEQEVFNSSG